MILRILMVFSVISWAHAGVAKPAISQVEIVNEGLITVGMAKELARKCDDVYARKIKGLFYLNSLKSHLQGLGYSSDEIKAYIENKAEKDRLWDIARERLRDLLAGSDGQDAYCAVAQQQIDAKTDVGRFLGMKKPSK